MIRRTLLILATNVLVVTAHGFHMSQLPFFDYLLIKTIYTTAFYCRIKFTLIHKSLLVLSTH